MSKPVSWMIGSIMTAALCVNAAESLKIDCRQQAEALEIVYNLNGQNQAAGMLSGDTKSLKVTPDRNYLRLDNPSATPLKLQFRAEIQAVLIPDFHGEDIAVYPSGQAPKIHVPADNCCLLAMGGNGRHMTTFLWSDPTAAPLVEGFDAQKAVYTSVTFVLPPHQAFFIGVNAAARPIWYKTAEKISEKTPVRIGWTPPFVAPWRITFRKTTGIIKGENGMFDAWFLAPKTGKPYAIQKGIYSFNQETGNAWASAVNYFAYPFRMLESGQVMLRFPHYMSMAQGGYDAGFPALIYLLSPDMTKDWADGMKNCACPATDVVRTKDKKEPESELWPANALREYLPQGVCDRLFWRNAPDDHYPATCSVTASVEKIFYRSEQAGQRENIVKQFDQMNHFVVNIRNRLIDYRDRAVALEAQARKYDPKKFAFSRDAHDLLGAAIQDANKVITTNKPPAYVAELAGKNVALIDDAKLDDEAKEDACKKLGREIRTIGGIQDNAVARMRLYFKALRCRATLAMLSSDNPAERDFLMMLRDKTAMAMHERYSHEGK